ncbi:carbon-nitrogen hydrolase family protein [candidate division CSSED10-310 bacterium]|uniref:Carbon-nitrogen hydrolase family protein n=1 Tax=candidate division CSSED10-310 bacterium TaxID=2855610 RepID=A0ABV6YWD2_UNCC1
MVKIGIIQMQSEPLKVKKNLSLAEDLIAKAVKDGAQLVVLPEMFNVGFYFGADLMTVAETLDGKTMTWLKSLTAKKNIYITTSIYEHYQGHYYNTMVMVSSDGNVQSYRKRNPTWFEVSVWRRSDVPGPGIFDTPFGRVGGVICFDSFSRESFEGLKHSAVDLVIIVACWGTSQNILWRPDVMLAHPTLKQWSNLASRAVPNHYATQLKIPTVFVNQGGRTYTPCQTPRFYPFPPLMNMRYDFCGNSSIRDSSGRIIVQAPGNEIDFYAVESVDVHPVSHPPEPVRSDISNRYLSSDYYIVQPPLIAKIFQALFTYGLQEVYEARRKQYTPS